MELLKGAILNNGKYRIESVLGQGGFGITYLASQQELNRNVAIKEFFMKDSCLRDDSGKVSVATENNREIWDKFNNKFLKEAKTIASLSHPNIVKIIDVFSENGTSYYVMEYVRGYSLSDYVKAHGKLSERESVEIIRIIANTLKYLHERYINHLDIKPANIMMEERTNRIILIDFGVSKHFDSKTGDSTTSTPLGMSNGYSPLEQYNKNGLDHFSPCTDIYSLGATLYKILTGITPPSAIEVSQNGLPAMPEYLSAGVKYVVKKSMSPKISDRPQSIIQFLEILNGKSDRKEEDEEATVIQTKDSHRKNNNNLIIWFFVIIALISGAVIYNNSEKSTSVQNQIETEGALSGEEITDDTAIETIRKQGSYGESSLDVEFPANGNPILKRNIMEWINERMGGTYSNSLDDYESLFEHYKNKLSSVDEGNGEYDRTRIYKAYEDSKVVTFITDGEFYGGGTHGIGGTVGTTFRKSDGKELTNDMINSYYDLKPYITEGLKKYFNVSSDEELMQNLQLNNSNPIIENIPYPSNNPWITNKGFVFWYSPYEIACYAAGSPTFTLPIEVVKPCLSVIGKSFLE